MGPVVAAAVCWPPNLQRHVLTTELSELNDSKQLRPAKREQLAQTILNLAYVGFGEATAKEVDAMNVHHASLLAGWRALLALIKQLPPTTATTCETLCVLLDGRFSLIHGLGHPMVCSLQQELLAQSAPFCMPHHGAVIKGDAQSAVIAAASVVAKTKRDAWVRAQAEDYPGYGWHRNAGYGTRAHWEGLKRYGSTPHHRQRFISPVKKEFP